MFVHFYFQLLKAFFSNKCKMDQNMKQFWLSLINQIEFYFSTKIIMSSKIDWNDMSDSDSEGHHHEEQHHEEVKDLPKDLPSLNKIVSSPFPEKKSVNNEQENLRKLENSEREQIWLYVPLYYTNNVEEVDKIIRGYQNLKKVQKFSKGWNVLTNRQNAASYITQGKKEERFYLKFYFSNKNEQESKISSYKNLDNMAKTNDFYDNKKVKYIPKSPKARDELKNMRSPEAIRRVESQNNYNQITSPKSPTYKNQNYKKYDDDSKYKSKNYNKQGFKIQDSQENDNINQENKGYKQKYVNKNSTQQASKGDYQIQSPRKKYVAKVEEQIKSEEPVVLLISPVKENKVDVKVQKSVDFEVKDDAKDISGEKKQKKKKKKNDLIKDNNNPFSFLSGI